MDNSGRFDKLRAYYAGLMPGLTESDWCVCEAMLHVHTLKKGDILLKQGSVCNYVSFINYGLVRMYYLVDGKEK